MAEEEVVTPDPDEPDEAELTADEVVMDDKGNKTVSLSTMLRYKKEAKAATKRIKELEPIAGRVGELEGRLNDASPVINAILTNPRLKAEALRIANGTHATAETREQPEDDTDATAYAEDMGFYLADGQTVDSARARRVLDRLDARHGRQITTAIRPLAGSFLSGKAEQNVLKAISATDDNGVPVATEESINEVVKQMGADGQHLLANPMVIELVLDRAAGIDRRNKRTPKAAEEPLYLESAGGGRATRGGGIDADLKASFARLGINEKDGQAAIKNLEVGARNRSGIALGGKH